MCGEKFLASTFFAVTLGSPPRMRGKVVTIELLLVSFRITPAYAGKRAKSMASNAA